MTHAPDIHGRVAPGFEPVREAFLENFTARGEVGAAFALIRDGETLVDLHAGSADRKGERPWTDGTIAPVFSTGKAITGIVVARMVDQDLRSLQTKKKSARRKTLQSLPGILHAKI